MSLIFEFEEMEDAKAFAHAVKKRFGLDGQVFDDADEAGAHSLFPFGLYPPVVLIDRVRPETAAEINAVKLRFGLKARDIDACREEFQPFLLDDWRGCATGYVAELRVEALAKDFDGKFVGT
jgi:hypothetical protein